MLYAGLYAMLYAMRYAMLYAWLYAMLYAKLYAMLYARLYAMLCYAMLGNQRPPKQRRRSRTEEQPHSHLVLRNIC